MNWSGSKCLVTGGSGFLARNLIPALEKLGGSVTAVFRNEAHLSLYPEPVRSFGADLTVPGRAKRLLDAIRPDFVFHLAGNVSGANSPELVVPMFNGNTVATVHLLDAANGLVLRRVITVASIEEYSGGTKPVSPYAVAKRASSLYAEYFRVVHQVPVTQVLLHFSYGPHQSPKKIIPYVITSYLRGCRPVLSTPNRHCDFVYVEDAVSGLIRAAEFGDSNGAMLEIRSGESCSLFEMAEKIRIMINGDQPPPTVGSADRITAEIQKEAHLPVLDNWGWRPSVTLERGLQKTIDWYRNEFSLGA